MKMRVGSLLCFGLMATAVTALANVVTLDGKITDSMCTKDHSMMAEGGKQPDPKECTMGCVKAGAKYVFVSGEKVYEIANQDMDALKTYAGGNVRLTGDVAADGNSIKAEKIEAAK